ncbi:hypothetical protein BN946_scf184885.g2 [Trametes cinnabarina]|uniref:Protein kinase domain-containing protein n=1 Tax=Pycnoporus cinnabarinus TaxID=5643 RepID=A0A060SV53_PYCCI|nr:hypothetical protein BN946_scf184885.g2 [Trametes cinnabarina]
MRFFAFAQDGAQRNLIIKIIEKGSSEYEINRSILEQQSTSSEKAAFPLLVMPMWGPYVHLTRMRRLREVVQFIKSTLRDICDQNVVVNCHSPGATLEEFAEILDEHRQADDVTYAFIDFGQSLQLPLDTSITDCRRPGDETGIARNHFKPPDGHLGEPYYNPFSYDVAALGFLFRCYFSEAVPALPCLAALFDRMTDYCPSRRMTAQQALEWFEDIIIQLPQGCLEARVMLDRSFEAMRDEGLYWTELSTEDQAKWGQYRTPPRPLWMRLLGFMSRNTLGFRILCFLRGHLQI